MTKRYIPTRGKDGCRTFKFLSKKSFNPQNLVNQKSVWEREQESNREAARFRERERQLTIERDHEELAKSRDGASGGHKAALRFM
jgi:hypothetical protein